MNDRDFEADRSSGMSNKPGPRTDRVADAVVIVVGLSLAMMFGLLYALTPPPPVATVEHQYTMQQQ